MTYKGIREFVCIIQTVSCYPQWAASRRHQSMSLIMPEQSILACAAISSQMHWIEQEAFLVKIHDCAQQGKQVQKVGSFHTPAQDRAKNVELCTLRSILHEFLDLYRRRTLVRYTATSRPGIIRERANASWSASQDQAPNACAEYLKEDWTSRTPD